MIRTGGGVKSLPDTLREVDPCYHRLRHLRNYLVHPPKEEEQKETLRVADILEGWTSKRTLPQEPAGFLALQEAILRDILDWVRQVNTYLRGGASPPG